jgi:dihydrofolate reductase
MTYVALACVDLEGGIGKDGKLPWHLINDMKHFRSTTMGHTVIMGRNTYESIGHPLDGRKNIIIGHDFESLDSVKKRLKSIDDVAFVIGGESLYQAMLPHCDFVQITVVHEKFVCDRFMPNLEEYGFKLLYQSEPVMDTGYTTHREFWRRCNA